MRVVYFNFQNESKILHSSHGKMPDSLRSQVKRKEVNFVKAQSCKGSIGHSYELISTTSTIWIMATNAESAVC